MQHINIKHVTPAGTATVAGSAVLLWAWNTLAELIGAPSADFKHVIAAPVIALVLRWLIWTGEPRHDSDGRRSRISRRSLP
jgi:hypothetical protein